MAGALYPVVGPNQITHQLAALMKSIGSCQLQATEGGLAEERLDSATRFARRRLKMCSQCAHGTGNQRGAILLQPVRNVVIVVRPPTMAGGVKMARKTASSSGAGVTVVTHRELNKMVSTDTRPSAAMKQAIETRNAKTRDR